MASSPTANGSGNGGDASPSVTVLHVDDDPDLAELTAEYLERESGDIEVDVKTSADDALDRLADDVDCVVSDYDMPGTDGIEFLERVRETHPYLPFILFTGKGSEAVASDAIAAGVTDYLQKGTGTDQYKLLCNRVENAVARRRARTNYRELFERIPVGLTIHDPDTGVIADANTAFADLFGYDRSDAVGAHLGEFPPEGALFDREETDRLVRRAVEEGPQTFEREVGTRDGERVWVEVTLCPTTIDGRRRVLAAVRDVTERKERERALARAKRKFQAVFEHANDAVFLVDVEADEILDCNPAAADLVGYSRDELLSMAASDLHPHDIDELEAFAASVREEGHDSTDDLSCLRKDGSVVPVEVSAAVCEIDGRTCLVNNARPRSDPG